MSLLQGLYDHPFNKTRYALRAQLKSLTLGVWGVVSTPEALLYDLWIILNKMAIKKFDRIHLGKKDVGKLVALWSLLSLKKEPRTSNFQSNEPPPNFKTIYALGKNLQHLPLGSGGSYRLQNFVISSLDYFEQNGYRKIVIRCIWGKECWEGLVVLRSLLTLKKGTRTSDFQWNQGPPNFIRYPFHLKCLCEK
jgi:hypothetical protein